MFKSWEGIWLLKVKSALIWIWHLASPLSVKSAAQLLVTVWTSNKSDQRYGSVFRREWLCLEIALFCVQQMQKRAECVMSCAGFSKRLYYRQLTPGAAQPASWLLGRHSAPKLPCNHQISFAGIHPTCQNNRHETDFFSSLFPAISVVSWKYVAPINHSTFPY